DPTRATTAAGRRCPGRRCPTFPPMSSSSTTPRPISRTTPSTRASPPSGPDSWGPGMTSAPTPTMATPPGSANSPRCSTEPRRSSRSEPLTRSGYHRSMTDLPSDLADDEVIRSLAEGAPTTWIRPTEAALPDLEAGRASAAARFPGFAPWSAGASPVTATTQPDTATTQPGTATTQSGTADAGGTIESPLVPAPQARQRLDGLFGARLPGRLWLKRD